MVPESVTWEPTEIELGDGVMEIVEVPRKTAVKVWGEFIETE
jgi:hypothetical protein